MNIQDRLTQRHALVIDKEIAPPSACRQLSCSAASPGGVTTIALSRARKVPTSTTACGGCTSPSTVGRKTCVHWAKPTSGTSSASWSVTALSSRRTGTPTSRIAQVDIVNIPNVERFFRLWDFHGAPHKRDASYEDPWAKYQAELANQREIERAVEATASDASEALTSTCK